ncbi:MAG: DNA mismatch repair endonuclease MutL [Rhodospirillaceae bacterium]
MTIRLLPDTLINQIAAGEVVERPAAAVKELVENAIDAGATRIDISIRDGGRSLIAVVDDGCGMGSADLTLAVERHATSKLPGDDLMAVATLGFRGEALPSIGAVSRLTLTSRVPGADSAWTITVEGGSVGSVAPAAHPVGTRIEVRDLFYAVPARLKFLKAPRTEQDHIEDVIQRLAMAHPNIAFNLTTSAGNSPGSKAEPTRPTLRYSAGQGDPLDVRLARLSAVLGRDFGENSVAVQGSRDGVGLSGFIGLPTLSRASSREQYLYVNARPVRDKLLFGAVRGAYGDLMPRDRHPALVLFLQIPGSEVDVNVHPAKTEVRFRDGQLVRGLIVSSLRHALAGVGIRTSTTTAAPAIPATPAVLTSAAGGYGGYGFPTPPSRPARGFAESGLAWQAPLPPAGRPVTETPLGARACEDDNLTAAFPLGVARAQLHKTYIIAETANGVVLVDQHAAHERLVHEHLKATVLGGDNAPRLPSQGLLIPEVVELGDGAARRLLGLCDDLARLGLVLEPFGNGAILVREVPAMLGQADIKALVRDLADLIDENGATGSGATGSGATGSGATGSGATGALRGRLNAVCASMACHGSIRAGKALSADEMNALLRQMEATPNSGQCSHGRPTYIELRRADIERLFERR